ncbi:MAG: ribosome maturation factor RimM [Bacillales bacterium]
MYLKIGTITKQVGLKGELRIYKCSSFSSRYDLAKKVYIKENNTYKELEIITSRVLNKNFFIISFKDYQDINLTNIFLNKDLYALKDMNLLNENEYYYDDLISLNIIDKLTKENIGKVISVEEFPAQITLKCISNNKKEFYIPFIDVFIDEININENYIVVNTIEGMI